MDCTIEQIEMTMVDLLSEIGATLKQLRTVSNTDEKEKLANIIVQLSSAQKNMADSMEILQDIDFINFDFDDDDEEEDFSFHKEPLDLRSDNRIEFNPNNSSRKKKKNKGKKKQENIDDDEDMPF